MLFCVLLLTACSKYSTNGENLYLQSRNGAKLEIPPPLTRANINDFYNLPVQNQNAMVNIEPPVVDMRT